MESGSGDFYDSSDEYASISSHSCADNNDDDCYDEKATNIIDSNRPTESTEVFHDAVGTEAPHQLSEEELVDRKLAAINLKDEGNILYKNSNFRDALVKYSEALEKCPDPYKEERSVMYSNRAACHIKLDAPQSALADCDIALELRPDYIRCLQRRAGLREDTDRLTEAFEDYKRLLELDPRNEQAIRACMTLPDRIKIQQEEMKQKMMDQLKQLGNLVLNPFGLSTDNFKVQKNPDSEGYSVNFVR